MTVNGWTIKPKGRNFKVEKMGCSFLLSTEESAIRFCEKNEPHMF